MLARTIELNNWTMERWCHEAVANLKLRQFKAHYCATAQEAADYILREADDAHTVGFGGSLSVADLKLIPTLAERGKEILNHGNPDLTHDQRVEAMRRQQTCDLFLTGSNALTVRGILVNIDGNGNRVAAMMYGPKKVIVVVGRNKLVRGDIEDAVHRVKERASPPNAMRLKRDTPCATSGFCEDCEALDRICRVTTIINYRPSQTDMHVLVVNEDMGL